MALILSAASGNFNSGATWVGGIVPGAADEARAATSHTITITANVTCVELSNAGTGTYVLNSGVTLTANCTNKSTTVSITLLTFSAASPATASIVGNITSGTVTGSTAVTNTGSGTLNVTGNALGGSGGGAAAISSATTGNVTLTGNATGGSGGTAAGLNGAATGIFTIIGNVLGGSVGVGAFCNGASTLTITGNVTGGSGNNVFGCNNATTGTVTITGNATGGSGSNAFGCNNATTGTLTISGGTYTASTAAHAVSSTNANSVVRISGSFIYASNGFVPINAPKFILLTTPTLSKTRYALNGSTTFVDMFTADNGLGQAAIADVRSGTVYASGILTGTLAVPPAGSVALGVPVDAGTGLAALTPAAVWGHATRTLTVSSGATATEIRQEMDTNSTKLANLDATVSSRLAPSGTLATVTTLTNAPTVPTAAAIATQVRTELGTELGRIDATVSSRLAPSGTLATVTTLTNAPTVPTAAAIATEVWSKPTTELTAGGSIGERSKNQSTVATTGAQLAAALS